MVYCFCLVDEGEHQGKESSQIRHRHHLLIDTIILLVDIPYYAHDVEGIRGRSDLCTKSGKSLKGTPLMYV
jgi:hypothetical protein